MARTRGRFADELGGYVSLNGEEARKEGSCAAAHRLWMEFRSKRNGQDSLVVLCEAERGEDHILAAYEQALQSTTASAVNAVLLRQYDEVKSGHDRVRELRDTHAAAK